MEHNIQPTNLDYQKLVNYKVWGFRLSHENFNGNIGYTIHLSNWWLITVTNIATHHQYYVYKVINCVYFFVLFSGWKWANSAAAHPRYFTMGIEGFDPSSKYKWFRIYYFVS
jgi:hypothetical protein